MPDCELLYNGLYMYFMTLFQYIKNVLYDNGAFRKHKTDCSCVTFELKEFTSTVVSFQACYLLSLSELLTY